MNILAPNGVGNAGSLEVGDVEDADRELNTGLKRSSIANGQKQSCDGGKFHCEATRSGNGVVLELEMV